MTQSMTIAETLRRASQRLREASIPNDLMDAQTLLASAMACDRTYLIINFNQAVPGEIRDKFDSLISRRTLGEPLQYITGHQEFFGLDFMVTPDVLIPRPETEIIIEETIRIAQQMKLANPVVVDAGTGSGCIAVTLARELSGSTIFAVDLSFPALGVAQRNAIHNSTGDRIHFIAADMLDAFIEKPFADFIISNPPYVPEREMPELQREVREWEPRTALTDEKDGLSFYRRLIVESPRRLKPGGHFICELGYSQSTAVAQLIDREIWFEPRLIDDLQGIPRTFVVQKRV